MPLSLHCRELLPGQSTLLPANADVFWKSDKENIATVDVFGYVTPHEEGKTKIIAYGKNNKVKGTCTITVNGAV